MPNYRRVIQNGGTYFFTVVTYKRQPLLLNISSVNLFLHCINGVKKKYPFEINAYAILPDHIHTIWTLPENDSDYSNRWRLIKGNFTKSLPQSKQINSNGEKNIWQSRFWEHLIRSQEDYNKHCDYIHYNPVKHGLVESVDEWQFSSFKDFVTMGFYPEGCGKEIAKEIYQMDLE